MQQKERNNKHVNKNDKKMKESTQQPELRGGLAAKEKGLVTRERTLEISNLNVNFGKFSKDLF